LKRLHTDHLDLYQFHRVCTSDDVERIFAPDGAVGTFAKAREEDKVRFLGFSAHTVEAALAMMDRFDFDPVLFPINFVCYALEEFGPQVLRRAKEKGVARLALKALAHEPLPDRAKPEYPNLWYRPVDDKQLARQALGFTLTEDVTAAIPPGDEQLFRLALKLAASFDPLSQRERRELLAGARGLRSLVAGLATPLRV
jgi:predicted aldo/keto reductase-like oxidoreductase